jgi:hypothetical protein
METGQKQGICHIDGFVCEKCKGPCGICAKCHDGLHKFGMYRGANMFLLGEKTMYHQRGGREHQVGLTPDPHVFIQKANEFNAPSGGKG